MREKETVKFVESDIYKKYSSDSLKAKLQITKSKVPNNYKLSDLNSNTNYYDDKKESVFLRKMNQLNYLIMKMIQIKIKNDMAEND
ncbi:hypothetical protein [Mycoplasmopsis adleri]|uniref:hypothetical protein n=1 Tax=Mycoplasmopsis adleri TaxID=51362 RepID=UPI00387383D4